MEDQINEQEAHEVDELNLSEDEEEDEEEDILLMDEEDEVADLEQVGEDNHFNKYFESQGGLMGSQGNNSRGFGANRSEFIETSGSTHAII